MLVQEINTPLLFIVISLVAIVIGGGIILLFTTFNNKKNKLFSEKLKAELDFQKRMHETELSALRSQMNPHFVHNSLNAILYYVQRNELDTTENYLVKFSKLIRLFFDFSRREFVYINEEITLLNNYLEIEKLRFEDKFDYIITSNKSIDVEETSIPAMLLQPIVENAINHGIFHKKGYGKLSIDFTYVDPQTYQVMILDNGIGFKAANKLKKNYRDTVNSHSSQVLKERIDLLNQTNQWYITFTMEDLSDSSSTTGTKVTFLIKTMNSLDV